MKNIVKLLVINLMFCTNVIAKEEPVYVNFEILGAVVGPTKVNGRAWDASFATGKTLNSISSTISNMYVPGSGIATSAIIDLIGKDAPKGKVAPDVIGYIVQTGLTTKKIGQRAFTPMVLANRHNLSRDSYMPNFSTGYRGWPIYKNTRFRIQLWDKDFQNHDNIGTVEITYEDISSAIEHGKPKWISVADQSMNQLLFILITATKSNKNAKSFINGHKWQ